MTKDLRILGVSDELEAVKHLCSFGGEQTLEAVLAIRRFQLEALHDVRWEIIQAIMISIVLCRPMHYEDQLILHITDMSLRLFK